MCFRIIITMTMQMSKAGGRGGGVPPLSPLCPLPPLAFSWHLPHHHDDDAKAHRHRDNDVLSIVIAMKRKFTCFNGTFTVSLGGPRLTVRYIYYISK